MRILLIGGTSGQVSSAFIEMINNHNRLSSNHTHPIELIALCKQQLDITQETAVLETIKTNKPGIVVNGAAYTAVDKAEDYPSDAYSVNRDGTKHLALACKIAKIPLLHLSTDYVFDGSQNTPYTETDKTNPKNVYGKSKSEGEEALRSILPHHIILRTSWVFSHTGSNFVKTMLRLADKGTLTVVADQFGSPTSANSIAKVLYSLCIKYQQENALPWGTYHFTGTPQTNWCEFANTIFSLAKKEELIQHNVTVTPISTEQYPTAAERPPNSTLDCDKILAKLHIAPTQWESDLIETIRHLKNT